MISQHLEAWITLMKHPEKQMPKIVDAISNDLLFKILDLLPKSFKDICGPLADRDSCIVKFGNSLLKMKIGSKNIKVHLKLSPSLKNLQTLLQSFAK